MSSIRTWGSRPPVNQADTSSPGASSAKPSTSKPQATLETVAGANAVSTRSVMSVAMLNRWNEVVGEGPIEVVGGFESPVGARGRVVHVGRRIERAEVVGDSSQALARRRRESEQRADPVGHRHERNRGIGPHEARV